MLRAVTKERERERERENLGVEEIQLPVVIVHNHNLLAPPAQHNGRSTLAPPQIMRACASQRSVPAEPWRGPSSSRRSSRGCTQRDVRCAQTCGVSAGTGVSHKRLQSESGATRRRECAAHSTAHAPRLHRHLLLGCATQRPCLPTHAAQHCARPRAPPAKATAPPGASQTRQPSQHTRWVHAP